MNDKELSDFIELLYPYFLNRLKKENFFKSITHVKNAVVAGVNEEENIDKMVNIRFPYDEVDFPALNKTGVNLKEKDLVSIEYWVDLKNAVIKYKV